MDCNGRGLFNSSGDGLSASIDTFFNLSLIANNPGSLASRAIVAQNGQALAQNFNTKADRLQSLQQQTDQAVGNTISQINSLSTQIANLTQRLAVANWI